MSDMESLHFSAGVHAKQFGAHRLLTAKFPYAIYYDIDGTIVYILAVLPMRRDPAWITGKLKGRR
ncbi:MAG: hypothetical protein ACI9QL_005332 [Candidatus Omnitrophota bacterium]|jgi:hypothetical protein